MNPSPDARSLAGWSVVCLRPSMQQAAVRTAVTARGARHVTLPGLRLAALPTTAQLGLALDCAAVVFTSPAAVHFAARQQALVLRSSALAFAVGAGTAAALARYGIDAIAPAADAMHSDGVLALPHWQHVVGVVGLVTAPGGRGVIAAGLVRRGLTLIRAEVYQRLPPRPDARNLRTLLASAAPRAVLVSSGEALEGILAVVPAQARTRLLESVAVASSPRLADLTRSCGFTTVVLAPAPTATAMLDALQQHVTRLGFR